MPARAHRGSSMSADARRAAAAASDGDGRGRRAGMVAAPRASLRGCGAAVPVLSPARSRDHGAPTGNRVSRLHTRPSPPTPHGGPGRGRAPRGGAPRGAGGRHAAPGEGRGWGRGHMSLVLPSKGGWRSGDASGRRGGVAILRSWHVASHRDRQPRRPLSLEGADGLEWLWAGRCVLTRRPDTRGVPRGRARSPPRPRGPPVAPRASFAVGPGRRNPWTAAASAAWGAHVSPPLPFRGATCRAR